METRFREADFVVGDGMNWGKEVDRFPLIWELHLDVPLHVTVVGRYRGEISTPAKRARLRRMETRDNVSARGHWSGVCLVSVWTDTLRLVIASASQRNFIA